MSNDNGAQVLVYGYIRAEEPDEIAISFLRKEMADYCKEHELRLANVCCDRGSDGTEMARPGFTAALDALSVRTSHALLVPALGHLSTNNVVRDGLIRMVRRTGAKLLVMYGPGDAAPSEQ